MKLKVDKHGKVPVLVRLTPEQVSALDEIASKETRTKNKHIVHLVEREIKAKMGRVVR